MNKKQKIKKGDFGYIQSQKKKRTIYTILALIPPLTVFFVGWIINKDRNTVFTVFAAVGCLPACKFAVSAIMMYLQKPMLEDDYKQIEQHKEGLVCAYELPVSAYEKQTFLDSVAVCGNNVVAYTSREKSDIPFVEKHIQTILRQNGYYVTIKVFRRLPEYLNRLDSMWEHHESLEEGIRFVPDENNPDLSRNELIMHTIFAITL